MVQWLMTVHLFPHVLRPWSTWKSTNTDVPEHIVQSLWNLKRYTANVFEKRARQTTLDKYFMQK
jgi:heme exporter protein D